jgi:hypothetical protein
MDDEITSIIKMKLGPLFVYPKERRPLHVGEFTRKNQESMELQNVTKLD